MSDFPVPAVTVEPGADHAVVCRCCGERLWTRRCPTCVRSGLTLATGKDGVASFCGACAGRGRVCERCGTA